MTKRTIETTNHVRALMILETTENKRDVDIYIRTAKDCVVTGEAEIRVSPGSFADLCIPVLEDLGYVLTDPKEAV